MKTLILAGGLGTRLAEETSVKPKPMVEVGGEPILWHIMKIYVASGYNEFIVALGYKGDVIKRYFLDYYYMRNNITVDLGSGRLEINSESREDWLVRLVDTGQKTESGGRIKRLASYLGQETFMMTYGDGVASIDLRDVVDFHRQSGRLATITAVRPPSRFGGIEFEGEMVTRFVEKSQIGEGWINGGFFVLEPKVLEYIEGDDTIFEREPLERLAEDRQLAVYCLEEFWQCMDTLRDVRLLNSLWADGDAPWKVWS